jgi:glycosidase
MEIEPHTYLRNLRSFLQRRRGEAILLGEVNLPFEQQREYFGDEHGDELHMLFDFVGMQAIYLAMARSDAGPIATALKQRPDVPPDGAYASFLRNHDELTLDKLSDSERQEVFDAFGSDPDMQLYDRGLRRRLPPMLGGDDQWLRMAYSLMFSMPGAPTLFYGEEIGMGENLAIDGRLAVRTPMQWTPAPAAGFTSVPADAVWRPFPGGEYGPDQVNVESQRTDPESLLNWFERMIRLRKSMPEIAWGRYRVIDVDDAAVLALEFRWGEQVAVTVHNLASRKTTVSVPIGTDGDGDSNPDSDPDSDADVHPAGSHRLDIADPGEAGARPGADRRPRVPMVLAEVSGLIAGTPAPPTARVRHRSHVSRPEGPGWSAGVRRHATVRRREARSRRRRR